MRILYQAIIQADHARVWSILADSFADIATWSRHVACSRPIPVSRGDANTDGRPLAGRSCDISAAGFGPISETIELWDPERMTLSYRIATGLPAWLASATNRWEVHQVEPGRCQLVICAEVRTRGALGWLLAPVLRIRMWLILKALATDLGAYANRTSKSTHDFRPVSHQTMRPDADIR